MGAVTHLIGADMASKLNEEQLTLLEMAIELEIAKNPVIREQLAPVLKQLGNVFQTGQLDVPKLPDPEPPN